MKDSTQGAAPAEAEQNRMPAGFLDLVGHLLLAGFYLGLIATVGIGESPLLAAMLVVLVYSAATAAIALAMSPTLRQHGFTLIAELLKADFAAHTNTGDERWERWWNPLSKRSVLKWFYGTYLICFAIGFAFVHPFVAVVINEMWVLLLLPIFLSHRVFKQRTHTSHSKAAVWLFVLGIAAVVLVGYSQYSGNTNEAAAFGWRGFAGLALLSLGALMSVSAAHHLPSVKQLTAKFDDNHPLLVRSREIVGEEKATERAHAVLSLAAASASHFFSFCFTALLVIFAAATGWSLGLPQGDLKIGGLILLATLMPFSYGYAVFLWYRGSSKATSVPTQAISYLSSPAALVAVAAFSLLGDGYWFADIGGLGDINFTLFAFGLAALIGINVGINVLISTKPALAETAGGGSTASLSPTRWVGKEPQG